jgi:hypothetical protein
MGAKTLPARRALDQLVRAYRAAHRVVVLGRPRCATPPMQSCAPFAEADREEVVNNVILVTRVRLAAARRHRDDRRGAEARRDVAAARLAIALLEGDPCTLETLTSEAQIALRSAAQRAADMGLPVLRGWTRGTRGEAVIRCSRQQESHAHPDLDRADQAARHR